MKLTLQFVNLFSRKSHQIKITPENVRLQIIVYGKELAKQDKWAADSVTTNRLAHWRWKETVFYSTEFINLIDLKKCELED